MCELAKLPMVICSEVIETVSLSGYSKVQSENSQPSRSVLSKYKNRQDLQDISLHQFFHLIKNKNSSQAKEYVPHYVGGSGQPRYPITKNYARVELLKHKPWSACNGLPSEDNMIKEFINFLEDAKCPSSVRLSLERAKLKNLQQKCGLKEATSPDQQHSNPINPSEHTDTIEVIAATHGIGSTTDEFQNIENNGLDIGRNYDWSKRYYEVR